MIRTNESNVAERLAVSFPMAVAVVGLIGWVVQSWISNQKS